MASVPAVVFSSQLTSALYGDAIAPMFAVVDLAPWASVVSVLVVPLVAELAEPVAYLGVVLPRLEARLGRSWLAATIVVALWAGEHALYPLLASGGGLDWEFAAYRVGSVLPFLNCTIRRARVVVVAVFLLRPNLRRGLVPMPFWSATTVGW